MNDWTPGRLDRLLLRLDRAHGLDLVPWCTLSRRVTRARWRRRNEVYAARGCRCGAPATWVHRDWHLPCGIPVMIFYCDEHRGVNTWQECPGPDGTRMVYGPRDALTTAPWRER